MGFIGPEKSGLQAPPSPAPYTGWEGGVGEGGGALTKNSLALPPDYLFNNRGARSGRGTCSCSPVAMWRRVAWPWASSWSPRITV